MLVLSLRGVAGSDESCGIDVEAELALELEEPVDSPGPTICKKISVLHRMLFSFLVTCVFLTTGPLVGITVFFAEFA